MNRAFIIRGVVIIVALIIAFVFAIWGFNTIWNLPVSQLNAMPANQVSQLSVQQRLEIENSMRSAAGQIVSGMVVAAGLFFTLIGLFFTWVQLANGRKQQEETKEATLQQLSIARAAQETQQFTQAIDQLGSDKDDIRIGGIFALGRLASKSPVYYWPIMEILTAHIRQHRRWLPPKPGPAPMDESIESFRKRAFEVTRAPADIQAILSVLTTRKDSYESPDPGPISLDRSELSHGVMRGIHLEKAVIQTSCLDWTDLREAHLKDARMEETWFRGAYLMGADLTGAHLDAADLRGAYITGAKLDGTDLRGANLMDVADLTEDQIRQARMGWTEVAGFKRLTTLPQHLKHLAAVDLAE